MKPATRNIAVGLFVLVALAGLGWMIVRFGAMPQALKRTYTVRMNFPSAGTIAPGDNVRVGGVVVGQVNRVDPVRYFVGGVQIAASIDYEFKIPRDCRAVIRTGGLSFGKPAIDIEVLPNASPATLPRDGTAVINGDILAGLEGLVSETAQRKLRHLDESVTRIAEAMVELLEARPLPPPATQPGSSPDGPAVNLSTVVQRMDALLARLNQLLDAESGDVSNTLSNIRKISEKLLRLAEAMQPFPEQAMAVAKQASATLRTADGEIKRVGEALVANSVQLAAALDRLNRALESAASGRGTVAKLLNDPALYDSLLLSADRLHQALIELQQMISRCQTEGVGIRVK